MKVNLDGSFPVAAVSEPRALAHPWQQPGGPNAPQRWQQACVMAFLVPIWS
jgi:hypothetical protein